MRAYDAEINGNPALLPFPQPAWLPCARGEAMLISRYLLGAFPPPLGERGGSWMGFQCPGELIPPALLSCVALSTIAGITEHLGQDLSSWPVLLPVLDTVLWSLQGAWAFGESMLLGRGGQL